MCPTDENHSSLHQDLTDYLILKKQLWGFAFKSSRVINFSLCHDWFSKLNCLVLSSSETGEWLLIINDKEVGSKRERLRGARRTKVHCFPRGRSGRQTQGVSKQEQKRLWGEHFDSKRLWCLLGSKHFVQLERECPETQWRISLTSHPKKSCPFTGSLGTKQQ